MAEENVFVNKGELFRRNISNRLLKMIEDEKIAKNLQLILMVIILISTVIAVGIEMYKMFENKSVTLADLLLMFLYLEVQRN